MRRAVRAVFGVFSTPKPGEGVDGSRSNEAGPQHNGTDGSSYSYELPRPGVPGVEWDDSEERVVAHQGDLNGRKELGRGEVKAVEVLGAGSRDAIPSVHASGALDLEAHAVLRSQREHVLDVGVNSSGIGGCDGYDGPSANPIVHGAIGARDPMATPPKAQLQSVGAAPRPPPPTPSSCVGAAWSSGENVRHELAAAGPQHPSVGPLSGTSRRDVPSVGAEAHPRPTLHASESRDDNSHMIRHNAIDFRMKEVEEASLNSLKGICREMGVDDIGSKSVLRSRARKALLCDDSGDSRSRSASAGIHKGTDSSPLEEGRGAMVGGRTSLGNDERRAGEDDGENADDEMGASVDSEERRVNRPALRKKKISIRRGRRGDPFSRGFAGEVIQNTGIESAVNGSSSVDLPRQASGGRWPRNSEVGARTMPDHAAAQNLSETSRVRNTVNAGVLGVSLVQPVLSRDVVGGGAHPNAAASKVPEAHTLGITHESAPSTREHVSAGVRGLHRRVPIPVPSFGRGGIVQGKVGQSGALPGRSDTEKLPGETLADGSGKWLPASNSSAFLGPTESVDAQFPAVRPGFDNGRDKGYTSHAPTLLPSQGRLAFGKDPGGSAVGEKGNQMQLWGVGVAPSMPIGGIGGGPLDSANPALGARSGKRNVEHTHLHIQQPALEAEKAKTFSLGSPVAGHAPEAPSLNLDVVGERASVRPGKTDLPDHTIDGVQGRSDRGAALKNLTLKRLHSDLDGSQPDQVKSGALGPSFQGAPSAVHGGFGKPVEAVVKGSSSAIDTDEAHASHLPKRRRVAEDFQVASGLTWQKDNTGANPIEASRGVEHPIASPDVSTPHRQSHRLLNGLQTAQGLGFSGSPGIPVGRDTANSGLTGTLEKRNAVPTGSQLGAKEAALENSRANMQLVKPLPKRGAAFVTPQDIIRTLQNRSSNPFVSKKSNGRIGGEGLDERSLSGSAFSAPYGPREFSPLFDGQKTPGPVQRVDAARPFVTPSMVPSGLQGSRPRPRHSAKGGRVTDLRPSLRKVPDIADFSKRAPGNGHESDRRRDGSMALSSAAKKILDSLDKVAEENRSSGGKRSRSPLGLPPSTKRQKRDHGMRTMGSDDRQSQWMISAIRAHAASAAEKVRTFEEGVGTARRKPLTLGDGAGGTHSRPPRHSLKVASRGLASGAGDHRRLGQSSGADVGISKKQRNAKSAFAGDSNKLKNMLARTSHASGSATGGLQPSSDNSTQFMLDKSAAIPKPSQGDRSPRSTDNRNPGSLTKRAREESQRDVVDPPGPSRGVGGAFSGLQDSSLPRTHRKDLFGSGILTGASPSAAVRPQGGSDELNDTAGGVSPVPVANPPLVPGAAFDAERVSRADSVPNLIFPSPTKPGAGFSASLRPTVSAVAPPRAVSNDDNANTSQDIRPAADQEKGEAANGARQTTGRMINAGLPPQLFGNVDEVADSANVGRPINEGLSTAHKSDAAKSSADGPASLSEAVSTPLFPFVVAGVSTKPKSEASAPGTSSHVVCSEGSGLSTTGKVSEPVGVGTMPSGPLVGGVSKSALNPVVAFQSSAVVRLTSLDAQPSSGNSGIPSSSALGAFAPVVPPTSGDGKAVQCTPASDGNTSAGEPVSLPPAFGNLAGTHSDKVTTSVVDPSAGLEAPKQASGSDGEANLPAVSGEGQGQPGKPRTFGLFGSTGTSVGNVSDTPSGPVSDETVGSSRAELSQPLKNFPLPAPGPVESTHVASPPKLGSSLFQAGSMSSSGIAASSSAATFDGGIVKPLLVASEQKPAGTESALNPFAPSKEAPGSVFTFSGAPAIAAAGSAPANVDSAPAVPSNPFASAISASSGSMSIAPSNPFASTASPFPGALPLPSATASSASLFTFGAPAPSSGTSGAFGSSTAAPGSSTPFGSTPGLQAVGPGFGAPSAPALTFGSTPALSGGPFSSGNASGATPFGSIPAATSGASPFGSSSSAALSSSPFGTSPAVGGNATPFGMSTAAVGNATPFGSAPGPGSTPGTPFASAPSLPEVSTPFGATASPFGANPFTPQASPSPVPGGFAIPPMGGPGTASTPMAFGAAPVAGAPTFPPAAPTASGPVAGAPGFLGAFGAPAGMGGDNSQAGGNGFNIGASNAAPGPRRRVRGRRLMK